MAITKVSQYNSTPTTVADYAAQNEHIQGFINQANGLKSILYQSTSTVVPTIAEGAYIAMGGTLYLADAEYTILGTCSTSSDNYIYLTVSGDELTATWTQSISGYSWNSIYNYYSDGTNALLQYKVRYSSSSYLVNLYSPLFQDLSKTASPTFAGETVNGNITVSGTVDGINVSSEALTNSSHRSNTSNPHSVSKEQITGLKSTDSPTFASVKSRFIELGGSTPFVDFHFNDSTSDYTSRIIESSNGTLEVTNNLTVDGQLTVASVESTNGYLLHNSWEVSNPQTENTIFDKFSPYIPNVGDTILCSGRWKQSLNDLSFIITSIKRTSSTQITFFAFTVVSTNLIKQDLPVTNGSTNNFAYNINISW